MPSNPAPLCEAISYQQVRQITHRFYQKLLQHKRLGRFFDRIENFSEHEKRVADFWWMTMGGQLEKSPGIDMIGKHFPLGIQQEDLETWLVLFGETLGETLADEDARRWMDKALHIAARIKQIVIDHRPLGVQIEEKS